MCGATEIESAYSRYAGVPFPNYGCGGRRCFYQSDYDREVGLYRTGRRHFRLCYRVDREGLTKQITNPLKQ